MRLRNSLLTTLITTSTLLSASLLTPNVFASESKIWVVTNNTQLSALSKTQLKQIYMEGGVHFPIKPINMAPGAKIRSVFNAKIIGLTETRIKAYWAQMQFTGRAKRPQEFDTVDNLLEYLQTNPDYIAYVPSGTNLPDSLKIVYSLNY